ncbi:MAG: hypothetical protein FJX80_05940 [Bacteroidetes bacterium]|nr:hypothetical protein [Bacteroidota bacterium]
MKSPEFYYFSINNKVYGPYTQDEFKSIKLPQGALICNNLDQNWKPYLSQQATSIERNNTDIKRVIKDSEEQHKRKPSTINLEKKPISTDAPRKVNEESKKIEQPLNNPVEITANKNEVVNKKLPFIAIVSSLLIISTCFYFLWLKPYLRDKNAERLYSFVGSLVFRSTPVAGIENNSIGNIKYGSELIVYSNLGDWVNCKFNGEEGYASNKFLLNKQDFYLLNSIFGDQTSREVIETAKCRKALLDYYKTNNIFGLLDEQIQNEVYGAVQNKENWVIYTKPKNIKPNTVIYPRVMNKNSKYTDFGCVIRNVSTGKRKFLFFTFNDYEEATLVTEQDAPDSGDVISVKIVIENGIKYVQVNYTSN